MLPYCICCFSVQLTIQSHPSMSFFHLIFMNVPRALYYKELISIASYLWVDINHNYVHKKWETVNL